MDFQELIKKSEYVINNFESAEAQRLVKPWQAYLGGNAFREQSPHTQEQIKQLAERVRLIAFSHLEDDDSAEILEHDFLEFLNITQSIDSLFMAKLFFVPYSLRGELREKLKAALLRNNQRLGQKTIGEWLKEFDRAYDPKTRSSSAIVDFANSSAHAGSLSPAERQVLKTTLHIYDYFLIYTLPATGEEFEKSKKFYLASGNVAGEGASYSGYAQRENATPGRAQASKNIPLREAVSAFPKLGEQMVTSQPIKLKNFDRPVRPSVRNWIYDYTSHLGQTGHSSMDRMNYLFRSENTARLTSPEREKLGIILRSFDENVPLPVDGERQEIVFENLATPARNASHIEAGGHNTQHITQPLKQSPAFPPPKADRLAPEVRNSSKSNFPETPQGQTASPQHQTFVKPYLPASLSEQARLRSVAGGPATTQLTKNIVSAKGNQISDGKFQDSAPGAAGMQFVNPYPGPAAPDSEHSGADDNIANVRFSEGVAKKYEPPAKTISQSSTPPAPREERGSSKPSFSRNIIRPHFRSPEDKKPEPKIEGNIVDLSGKE